MLAADLLADDEAAARARVAAEDARIEVHVVGLEAARLKEGAASTALERARNEVDRLEADWAAAWAALGIDDVPTVDTAPTIVALLVTAHAAHAKDLSAAGQISELADSWAEATALVDLPAASTTAAWRAQAEVLEQVASLQEDRARAQGREAKARTTWESFRAEAIELLQRHGAHVAEQEVTPAQVELGLAQLVRRHGEAAKASATRRGYREQIDEKTVALDDARLAAEHASTVLERLATGHDVEVGGGLDELADRAERASDPLAREADRIGLPQGRSRPRQQRRRRDHPTRRPG